MTPCGLEAVGGIFTAILPVGLTAQTRAQGNNTESVGSDDLQERSAYQPIIENQGDRSTDYVEQEAVAGSARQVEDLREAQGAAVHEERAIEKWCQVALTKNLFRRSLPLVSVTTMAQVVLRQLARDERSEGMARAGKR